MGFVRQHTDTDMFNEKQSTYRSASSGHKEPNYQYEL